MEMFLLVIIAAMVLVTMVCAIMVTIIEVKDEKQQPLVKKTLGITAIALIVVLVIGLAFGVSNFKKDDVESNNVVTLETAGFNEVSLSEYLELIKEDQKNIILVARPTCTYCEKFTPILKQAMDDMDLTINYIDTDKFSNDDWNTFYASLSYLSENEWGTPLTLIVQNGEVLDVNQGYVELNTIETFFSNNGFGE